jgi:hypothetical protein
VVLFGAQSVLADVVLSTNFSTTTGDNVNVYDGSTTTARSVGVISNWTVADAAKVDVAQVTSFTAGTHIYGNTTDTVKAGEWVTMLGDGSYQSGTINATRRVNNAINMQFNSTSVGNSSSAAPANMGIFTFVFEVKQPINGLSATFDMGTGTTSGGWYTATAAQNGFYNVRIVGIGNATDFLFYSSAQAAGAGAPYNATAVDQTGTTLAAGLYRLEVQMTNKTQNQRYTIDNFSLLVVPEPATLSLLAFGGLLALRRNR